MQNDDRIEDEIKEGKLWKGEEREVLHLNTTKLFGDRWSGDITVNGNKLKLAMIVAVLVIPMMRGLKFPFLYSLTG